MRKVLTVLVALSLLLISGKVMAEETPTSYKGITVVDSDWVKANTGKVKVYDARKKNDFVEKHIAGAIHADYDEKSVKTLDFDSSQDHWDIKKYPTDKNASVVIYCNGPACWRSFKTAILLVKAGYTNVHWLREGFPAWDAKGYPTE